MAPPALAGTFTSGGTRCAEAKGQTERDASPPTERRPQGNPETGESSAATNRPNAFRIQGFTGPPCGCMFGRDGHEEHCPTRITSPASLPAARASWLHLRWLGLVDREGFVEGILRDLGRAS